MGMIAHVYDSPLGNCSNRGLSSKFKKVVIVNVEGPFVPDEETPPVELIKRDTGNIVARPLGLEGKWTMFGGAFVHTSDSRFHEKVRELSGYAHGFPVALHDRVE